MSPGFDWPILYGISPWPFDAARGSVGWFCRGEACLALAYELPISSPAKNTSVPPNITCNIAETRGVSM